MLLSAAVALGGMPEIAHARVPAAAVQSSTAATALTGTLKTATGAPIADAVVTVSVDTVSGNTITPAEVGWGYSWADGGFDTWIGFPETIAAATGTDGLVPLTITIPSATGTPTVVYTGPAVVGTDGVVRPYDTETGTTSTFDLIEATYTYNPAAETPAAEGDALTLEVYDALTVMEEVPDAVIAQGDQATLEYLEENLDVTAPGEMSTFGIVGCISAIGVAIFSIVGPISKIKAAVKAAGGAWKLAKVLSKAYKAARKAGFSRKDAIRWAKNEGIKSVTRADYKNILLSLFSVGAVVGECFE